jgi:hypothetical protein
MKFDIIRYHKKINAKFQKFLFELLDETEPSDFDAERRINLIPGMKEKMQRSVQKNAGRVIKNVAALFPIAEIGNCCNFLHGYGNIDSVKKVDGKIETDFVVTHANYCGNRFCSICTAKDSRIKSLRLEYMWDKAIKQGDYTFLFLTLTVPNQADGFRKSCDYMQKAVNKLITRMGWDPRNNTFTAIDGVYGQYEITIEKQKGKNGETYWHPHLHLLIAYKKECVKNIEVTYTGKIKSIDVYTNKKQTDLLHFDNNTIRIWWYQYLQEVSENWFPRYTRDGRDMSEIGYEVDFRPIKDNGDKGAVKELSKYLTRLFDINSTKDFLTYCIDCYGMHQRIGKGIFRWKNDYKDDFNEWLDSQRMNKDGDEEGVIIQNRNYIEFICEFCKERGDYVLKSKELEAYFYNFKDGEEIIWKKVKGRYEVTEEDNVLLEKEEAPVAVQLEFELLKSLEERY